MPALLVTGGARGIGRATAILAAERGWPAVVNYRSDADAANETVAAVESLGVPGAAIRADVSLEADVLTLFDAAESAVGPLGGVVINAGIVGPAARLADMDSDRLRRGLQVNVYGALLCAREAARRMGRSRGGDGGAIVLVSSMAAKLGAPCERVDYAAAKGAIDSLTIGLARELGPDGIRVNAVRPGLIRTDIHASGGQPDRAEALGGDTPLGRAGEAAEVAEAILWLLGESASYTHGAIVDVAGGR